jgi:hypothetical protein
VHEHIRAPQQVMLLIARAGAAADVRLAADRQCLAVLRQDGDPVCCAICLQQLACHLQKLRQPLAADDAASASLAAQQAQQTAAAPNLQNKRLLRPCCWPSQPPFCFTYGSCNALAVGVCAIAVVQHADVVAGHCRCDICPLHRQQQAGVLLTIIRA